MDNIKDVVRQVIEKIAEERSTEFERLEASWKKVLKNQERDHSKLLGEKNSIVYVCVESSAWLYQMSTRKQKILEGFKKDHPHIKDISFKIGKIE